MLPWVWSGPQSNGERHFVGRISERDYSQRC